VAFVIRTVTASVSGRFADVTMSVQQWQVVFRFLPALGFGKDMIDFDRGVLSAVQPTGLPCALLLFQEPGDLWFYCWVASQSCAPIDPVAVIRTPGSLHFHITPMGRVGMTEESCPTLGRLKRPALAVVHPPVFACAPVFGGVRMSVDCPAPPHGI
jgi:hypothetical protein